MKRTFPLLVLVILLASACTSQKKLAYLNNLPETGGTETFEMAFPDYKLQPRDVLYITIKGMTPDGRITDFLTTGNSTGVQMDATGGYLSGYVINSEGNITIPAIGTLKITGLNLDDTRKLLQVSSDKVFKNSTVECKLQSFRYTVIGEVNSPGLYINYGNYLTVLEAIGNARGLSDYGDRNNILVIRPIDTTTQTFTIDLQDKNLLLSEAYFLLPNDVIIVQPIRRKIFNLNAPIFTFALSTFTSALSLAILILYTFK